MNLTQLRNGNQAKPYANHVYKWIVTPENNETEDEVLDWCKKNLKDAPKNGNEYYSYIRENHSFHEEMMVICGGFYNLIDNKDGSYTYIVEQEYID